MYMYKVVVGVDLINKLLRKKLGQSEDLSITFLKNQKLLRLDIYRDNQKTVK